MSIQDLDLLLSRLDGLLAESSKVPYFELLKTTQIVEHAQKELLRVEIEDPPSKQRHDGQREMIRSLLERLADRQDAYEQARIAEEERLMAAQRAQEVAAAAAAAEEAKQSQKAQREGQSRSTLSTQEHILQEHRSQQESLTDDLLSMAQTLRKNQSDFGKAISADNELIERTGEALNRNADRMKATGGRLGQYAKKSSGTTCLSLVAILVALLGVVFMIGVIKVT